MSGDGLPPADAEAEKQLNGSLFWMPELFDFPEVARLRPHHFFSLDQRRIFAELFAMRAEGVAIDPATLGSRLKAQGEFEAVGGQAVIASAVKSVPHGGHGRTFADDVFRAFRHREQWLLVGRLQKQIADKLPPEDIDGQLGYYLENVQHADNTADAFEVLNCQQLAEGAFDLDYLIDNVMPKGQPGVIGAPPKTMKTTFAVDLGLSLATGGYFLGYFRVRQPARVMMFSAESGIGTLQLTAKSIAAEAGLDLASITNLFWCEQLPKLGSDRQLARLEATYKRTPFDVLIFDPLYKGLPNIDPKNIFAQGELLEPFSRWCCERGITLVFVHHLKKGVADPYAPPELADLSYAGIAEHVRWWLLLSRREKYIPPAAHRLWMATGGSAGHSGLWAIDVDQGEFVPGQLRKWDVRIQNAQEAQRAAACREQEAKLAKLKVNAAADQQTLLKTLERFPEGETKTGIRNASLLRTERLDEALRVAIAAGTVVTCDLFKSGKKTPIGGYRLATSTTGTDHRDSSVPLLPDPPAGRPYVIGRPPGGGPLDSECPPGHCPGDPVEVRS
ncbi:MAG: AAA family ATPase [Pirellulaceae bacterium]|nr:AAA family ATPase [Pirellulaceae bacterium]